MSIRWTITDRSTGAVITAGQPRTQSERGQLKVLIKQTSRLGMRRAALCDL